MKAWVQKTLRKSLPRLSTISADAMNQMSVGSGDQGMTNAPTKTLVDVNVEMERKRDHEEEVATNHVVSTKLTWEERGEGRTTKNVVNLTVLVRGGVATTVTHSCGLENCRPIISICQMMPRHMK